MLQRSDFTTSTSSTTTKTAFPSAKKNNDGNSWKRSADDFQEHAKEETAGNAKRQRCLIAAIPDGMQIDPLPTSTATRKMAVPVPSSTTMIMLDNDESIMMMINPQDYYEDKWDC
jgi:hypothetical protein